MTDEDIRLAAGMMIGKHGAGASLLAYEQIVRTMREGDRHAATCWASVLIEIEAVLNRR